MGFDYLWKKAINHDTILFVLNLTQKINSNEIIELQSFPCRTKPI